MSERFIPPPLDELLAQRLWVRALARRLVAREDWAGDVEQAAWVEAIERPPRRAGPARGWLAVVLRNAARKLGRAEGRRARHESGASAGNRSDAPADELVAAAELQQRVGRAVLELEEPYRTAILLRFYDDLTPAEIGERVGIPVDTVRTRIRRAIEKLRGRLDRDHGGDRAAWAVPLLAWDTAARGVPGGGHPGDGRGAGTSAAPTSASAAATVAGGVAMGIAKKVAVAAVALLLVAGGVALVRSTLDGGGAATADGTTSDAAARRPAPRALRAADPADGNPNAEPEPVDLGLCDRDLDLHGTVVRTDGTRVAGARVAAVSYPWRRTSLGHGRGESVPGPGTRTARDGTFALRLRRGEVVSLRVTAPGLVDAELEQCQAGERVRVVLAPGVRLRIECHDAAVTAPPAGDEGAPGAASARPAGAPGAGVRLRVFNSPKGDVLITSREVTTDASGVAVVDDLPPSQQFVIGLLSDGIGDPPWTPVILPAAGEVTQRIVLPAGRTIRGRVTDATTGTAIAGARIGMGSTLTHAVESAADGTYALPGWTGAGHGEIEAHAPGYTTASATVGNRDVVVDLALVPGFAATGRIVGADGVPVPGAQVSLIASVRTDAGRRTSRGHTVAAADGAFRIDGLARDMTHDLTVVAAGHGRILRTVSSPESGDLPLGDVVLPLPQEIAGRVVNTRGEPVPRVQVVLRGPDVGDLVDDVNGHGSSELRRTDDLGRFRFPDLAPGGYSLCVIVPDVPRIDVRVDLPAGTPVVTREIVAGAGRSLVVRLTDEQGRAIANAAVYLAFVGASDPGAQTSLRTGTDGCARFTGLPRRLQVMVLPAGSATLLATVWRDVADDAEDVEIVLRATRWVRVRVLDPSGRRIARATVRAFRAGEIEWWVTTDGSGDVEVPVPASGATIEFSGVVDGAESGWTARCDELPEGDVLTLRSEPVRRDRTLRVRVESPDGEPIPGARVTVAHREWQRPPNEETGADGGASFEGLPERELRVTATNVGDWVLPARMLVTPGGQDVVLRARRGVAIRGTLVRPGGQAARGHVEVRLPTGFGDFEDLTSRDSGTDGRFTLLVPEGVAGPFDIYARAKIDGLDIYGSALGTDPGADVRITLRPAPPR